MDKFKCKLIVFSDIHYAPEPPVNNGSKIDRKLTHLSLPLTRKLITEINNTVKPDIVINLGDLIEDFLNHDIDIENIKYILNVLKEVKSPIYSLAGNHDLRSMKDRKEIEEIMGYEHSTFSIDFKGYHFIFLGLNVNSKLNEGEGGIFKTKFISEEDVLWLENDLKSTSLPVLIFSHFGIAEDNMKGNCWFENCPENALLGNRKEIKNVFKFNKNIIAVFSGHQHWTKVINENGISYYVVGSLTENIKNDGVPDGVYYEVELNGDMISVQEKHIKIN